MTAATVFVTGTDTEIGKTRVCVALLKAAAERGLRVAGYKPVAAGAEMTPAGWRNADGLALQAASNIALDYAQVNPCVLPAAVAPHIAAAEAGIEIHRGALLDGWRALAEQTDLVVVEGAGGWRVPLGPGWEFADLVSEAGWPVVLVVGMKLGCLNHASLSAQSIASRARLLGWVANLLPPAQPHLAANLASLRQLLPAPCLAELAQGAHDLCLSELGQRYLQSGGGPVGS